MRPLVPRVDREIMLVHRKHRALSPVAQAAWDLVKTVAVLHNGVQALGSKGR